MLKFKKEKIIGVFFILLMCVTFIGCNQSSNNTLTASINPDLSVIDYSKPPEDILTNYTNEGISYLKANYTDTKSMSLAVKLIGQPFLSTTYTKIDGTEANLSDYQNKNIILEYIQLDNPEYLNLEKNLEGTDIISIRIFVNSTIDEVNKYYSNLGIANPKNVLIEDISDVTKLGVYGTPTYIFIDKSGRVSYVLVNNADSTLLTDIINDAFLNVDKIYNKLNLKCNN